MYTLMVLGLTIAAPVLSVLIELLVSGGSGDPLLLIGKWFVFWAVGVRLFTAGISQAAQPDFTVQNILGGAANVVPSADPVAGGAEPRRAQPVATLQIVQELGFANISLGLLGLLTLPVPAWVVPAALVAGVFYALAAVRHVPKKNKSRKEWIATVTDAIAAAVLLVFILTTWISGAR
jgi:hypothetical protein